jgi:hypothetical protein
VSARAASGGPTNPSSERRRRRAPAPSERAGSRASAASLSHVASENAVADSPSSASRYPRAVAARPSRGDGGARGRRLPLSPMRQRRGVVHELNGTLVLHQACCRGQRRRGRSEAGRMLRRVHHKHATTAATKRTGPSRAALTTHMAPCHTGHRPEWWSGQARCCVLYVGGVQGRGELSGGAWAYAQRFAAR